MSFSGDIINEINLKAPSLKHCIIARGYGVLLFSKNFSFENLSLQTKHSLKAEIYKKTLFSIFGITTERAQIPISKTDVLYIEKVINNNDKKRVLTFFGYKNIKTISFINTVFLKKPCCQNSFIKGAFIACGSVSSPEKGYHLEFVLRNLNLAEDFQILLNNVGFFLKIQKRNDMVILYTNDSSEIEDLLTYLGAITSSLSLMEVKVYKNLRNQINRQTNCETANITKTISAAAKQIEAIKKIQEKNEFENLSPELYEVAKIRLENDNMSLKEIGEMLINPISRSGVNHRFKKIIKIAEQL